MLELRRTKEVGLGGTKRKVVCCRSVPRIVKGMEICLDSISEIRRPMDFYRYRQDSKRMRDSGTDESMVDTVVSILARGNCLPAAFDAKYTFNDCRDMRDCRVGGGWRLICCYSERKLILVGLMKG